NDISKIVNEQESVAQTNIVLFGNIQNHTLKSLQKLCQILGLSDKGKKGELTDRIIDMICAISIQEAKTAYEKWRNEEMPPKKKTKETITNESGASKNTNTGKMALRKRKYDAHEEELLTDKDQKKKTKKITKKKTKASEPI